MDPRIHPGRIGGSGDLEAGFSQRSGTHALLARAARVSGLRSVSATARRFDNSAAAAAGDP
jgi:hypothetical protein